MKKIAKWTTAACAAAALALVAGCASVQDMDALQGQVDVLTGELAAAQAAALAAADSAMSEAKAAGMAAGDAAGTADAAMNAASEAAAGGAANAEKLDRMFEKVMMK